ncbi:putative LPS assembly protein LptD [Fodinibius sediminis]|uniref:LPS assembly outer membrane protein LptD (Organic solvent tolerance protein OstA) n=1 Tax=Fodinibius sediminis TaxID=1214077 RepID=A0A521AH92_9BACT|nr:putative LPS assembly protein LptD [Fodinibius sediminis]SMO34108.1 LPS assembly outer membrane protein LptD (organic solvent tolerance protein OstA) [Fodinibius sediminis]
MGSLLHAQDLDLPVDTLQQEREGQQGARSQQGSGTAPTPEQEGQINFQSSDSLVFVFDTSRTATLYGSASVAHSAGQLKAGKVSLNLDSNIVSADTQTPEDTLSKPVLTRENNQVRSNRIDFNYKTEKGRFEVARISIQDGNVTGTRVKKTAPHVVFLEDAIYSTCNLDHPHYYIKADRMKVVDEEKVFFEKARLYILDIPYPLVFPFGYLPGKFDRQQSGLLEPTYAFQNKQTRGIGLQNLGWFQYFNDYITAQASMDIFTSGSYFVDAQTNYRLRDKFDGSIQLGYSKERRGLEPTDPSFSTNVQKRLAVSHQQDFSPYASFNANINLRTADYYQQNSYDVNDRAETSTSSNINYRYRHPENLYNFNISVRQNQNFKTNVTRLSGPDMNFSLKRFSPFENEQTTSQDQKWYENVSVSYQNTFDSEFNYSPVRRDSARYNWFEALINPSKYKAATGDSDHYQYGFRQQADVSLGQILNSRFLNLSANANYNEYWFPTSTRKSFVPDSNEVVDRSVRGFTTARDFSTGLSFSTTVYGLMNAKVGKIQSFRHTLRPSLSLSYRPDFSSDFWGFYRTVQTDSTGRTQRYSIFENEVFNGPGRGEQRALGFSLNNTFEAKQVKRDSTGEKQENVIRLIDQLSLSSSYNFAADSLKLADLNTSFSARIVDGMSIRASANFNFYDRDESGNKIDRYLLTTSGKPFEMTRFSASTSYSFEWGSGGLRTNNRKPHFPENYDPLNQRLFHPVDPHFNTQPVQEFNSPFSFSVNFSYRWNLNPRGNNRTSATINANNINLKLTPRWDFRTQIGYDFVRQELTPSQFSLNRSMHDWNLSYTMNPFGEFQYYFFSLRINAGRLQGIIQKLPILNNLERSSSPTGRAPRGF